MSAGARPSFLSALSMSILSLVLFIAASKQAEEPYIDTYHECYGLD